MYPPARPLVAKEALHMHLNRRGWMKAGGLTLLGSGFLSRVDRVAAMQAPAPSRGSVRMKARASIDLTSPGPGKRTCGGAATVALFTASASGMVA